MKEKIFRLAHMLGVPLSERSVSGNYQYDGETIGIFYQKWDFDDEDNLRFQKELIPIPAFDILHDMAHHIVSYDWCRNLPEWGLWVGIGDYSANGGVHLIQNYELASAIMDGLLPEDEMNIQEWEAFILGVHYCHLLDVWIPKVNRVWLPDYLPGGDKEQYLTSAAAKAYIPTRLLTKALDWTKSL